MDEYPPSTTVEYWYWYSGVLVKPRALDTIVELGWMKAVLRAKGELQQRVNSKI